MEKRIELEKRGRPSNQITELNLDNCRSTNIVGLTDEFSALESLSLINVGLTTLKGFPKLPNLKRLELSDNRISNGLNHLDGSLKLSHLNLSGNKIKDYGSLQPLSGFNNLEVLDLFNNEVTNLDDYREKLFSTIGSLKYLDGFDINDLEAPSEDGEDDEVNGNDSDEEGSDDDEEEDISLAEVYNDDIEEDNSDWFEEDEDEAEDDEEEDEESNDEAAVDKSGASDGEEGGEVDAAAAALVHSPTRGKKRKHDG